MKDREGKGGVGDSIFPATSQIPTPRYTNALNPNLSLSGAILLLRRVKLVSEVD